MTERLYRSTKEKKLGGVCGGLAEFFDVDVTIIRLIALLMIFMGGVGILAYIAALIIIPRNPMESTVYGGQGNPAQDLVKEVVENVQETAREFRSGLRSVSENPNRFTRRNQFAGGILILLGVFFLLDQWFPVWYIVSKMWPLVLIVIGATMLMRRP